MSRLLMHFVGWVERSDTHHMHAPMMGIAKALHPSYGIDSN
jgi:hypothetical protein